MNDNSITSDPFRTRLMSTEEMTIIIDTLQKFRDDRITFLAIVETLKDNGDIDAQNYENTVRRYRQLPPHRRADQLGLIVASLNQLTFDKALAILKDIGCDDIVRVLIQEKFKRCICHVNRVGVANVNSTLTYYKRMKTYVDNHVFEDPVAGLQWLIDMQTKLMVDKEIEIRKRQRAADRVVPLYVLLLQQHRTREDRIAILDAMKEAVPRALDTTSVDSVYHSQRAITEAIAGHHGDAIDHAHRAETISDDLETCFASLQSIHDHQYVYRQIYMVSHRDEDLREIIRLGDNVMGCVLDEDDEELRNQWKRVVLLYQGLSIMRITSLFKVQVDITTTLQDEDIARIDAILKEVRRISLKAEVRREMIYYICMARFKDITGDLVAALTYQDEAIRLANDGGVFFQIEKANIEDYMDVLKGRRRAQPSFGSTESVSSLGHTEPTS